MVLRMLIAVALQLILGALIVVSHSIIAWSLGFTTAFAVARVFGSAVRGSMRRAMVSGLLVIILVTTLYLAWGHRRAMYTFVIGLDHGFPYPDPAINALERWFDAGRPVSPGSVKLHGHYDLVGFILGMLVLVGASVSGFLCGALLNRRGVAQLDFGETSEAATARKL
jgi:hypothetical protein